MKNETILTDNITYLLTAIESFPDRIIAIYGNPGLGKTKALEFLTEIPEYKTCLYTALNRMTPYNLIATILYPYKVRPRSYAIGLHQLLDYLHSHHITILAIDEADLLTPECITVVRKIADIGKIRVILSGEPNNLYPQLKQDIRIFHRSTHIEFAPLTPPDAHRLVNNNCEISIEEEFIDRIYRESEQNLRRFKESIEWVERTCLIQGITHCDRQTWGKLPLKSQIDQQPPNP
jgi:DNA transposition AAA+ family ATPase